MTKNQIRFPTEFREALLRQVSRHNYDPRDFNAENHPDEPWIAWWSTEPSKFFAEIHDLENLTSFDSRYENALLDIRQHTEWNNDWDDDYILNEDSRFNPRLYTDEQFLKFVDTALRHDMNSSAKLLADLLQPMFESIGLSIVPFVRFGVEEGYRIAKVKGGISNQGRAHSSNPAQLEYRGLHFRSKIEIEFFKALYNADYLVAPLPVFVHRPTTRRVEPDFVIVKFGIWAIIEIDGKAWHHETPVAAAKRVEPFTDEDVRIIRFDDEELQGENGIENALGKIASKFENWQKSR